MCRGNKCPTFAASVDRSFFSISQSVARLTERSGRRLLLASDGRQRRLECAGMRFDVDVADAEVRRAKQRDGG